MRVGPSGFVGLDFSTCLEMLARRGHDPDIVALLLPAWEQGLKQAIEAKRPSGET